MTFLQRLTAPLALVLLAAAPAAVTGQTAPRDEAAAVDFFEKKVRPVLANHCYNCHSASTNSQGGLRVDDRNGLVHGGKSGPAVVPGDPDRSLLIQAVRHTHPRLKMPPRTQLAPEHIAETVIHLVAMPERSLASRVEMRPSRPPKK